MAFCAGCGEELADTDQFCASCGRSSTVEASSSSFAGSDGEPDASSGSARRKVKVVGLVIGLVVASVLVVGVIAVLSPSSSSSLALVFEPGIEGYGDVHFVKLGDPINRDTRALRDVQLEFGFLERLSDTGWTSRSQMSFEVGGGRLIAYSEEGEDDTIIAVVSGVDVTPVVEGRGWMSVYETDEGVVLARFDDSGTERCEIYRIDGVDAVERLARGDSCTVFQSGVALIIDSGSRGSDISLFLPGGSTMEFETDDTATRGSVSPNGSLLALTMEDSKSGESVGVYLFDASTGVLLNDLRPSAKSGVSMGAVLDSGAFVTVYESGGQILHFLTAEDSSVVVEGDGVDATVNPSGTLALIRAAFLNVGTGEYSGEYSVWNPLSGTLSNDIEIPVTNGFYYPMGWANDEIALIVDSDGDILGLDSDANDFDFGYVGDDFDFGSLRLSEGGLLMIQASSPDGRRSLTVLRRGSTVAVPVIDAFSLDVLQTSRDGQYVVVSALDDSDDRYRTLYVYDTANDDLIELDDDASFSFAQIIGDTVVYTAYDSDGDPETRQVSWITGERPEVLYQDAVAIVP